MSFTYYVIFKTDIPWFTPDAFTSLITCLNLILNNCKKVKISKSLTTRDVEKQNKFWIKRKQQHVKDIENFETNQPRLGSSKKCPCKDQKKEVEGAFCTKWINTSRKKTICKPQKLVTRWRTIDNEKYLIYLLNAFIKIANTKIRKSYGCRGPNAMLYF